MGAYLLIIPIGIMAAVLIPALKKRASYNAGRQADKTRVQAKDVQLGAPDEIADPSGYAANAVLTALAVAPEDHGPVGDLPHNEGWAGTMLGLKAKMSYATTFLEPHLFYGERNLGQVFIRIGPDEKIAGGSVMMSNRHVRTITVLRVASSAFQLLSDGGALSVSDDAPDGIKALVAQLKPDKVTWSDVWIAGGADGIVAARTALDGMENSFAYDLWLLEKIAQTLRLAPLDPARLGASWTVPYEMGKRLRPDDV